MSSEVFSITCAIVCPWAGAGRTDFKINMSSVPWSMSPRSFFAPAMHPSIPEDDLVEPAPTRFQLAAENIDIRVLPHQAEVAAARADLSVEHILPDVAVHRDRRAGVRV